jgi:hypothetical protein
MIYQGKVKMPKIIFLQQKISAKLCYTVKKGQTRFETTRFDVETGEYISCRLK